jgi:hypothetical protein
MNLAYEWVCSVSTTSHHFDVVLKLCPRDQLLARLQANIERSVQVTYQPKISSLRLRIYAFGAESAIPACRLQQEAGPTEETAMVKTRALTLKETVVGGRNVR